MKKQRSPSKFSKKENTIEVISCKDFHQKVLGFKEGASKYKGREEVEKRELRTRNLVFPRHMVCMYVSSKRDLFFEDVF